MRAIHFSPHTIEVGHKFAEGSGVLLAAVLSAVAIAGVAFVALGLYFWNFS